MLGDFATRVSMAGPTGREYFAIVSRADERAFAKLKRQAAEKIGEAIEAGLEPGEVRWR